jgi:hypothetical protein
LADAICLDAYLGGFDMGKREKCFQKSREYDVHVSAGVDIRNKTHFLNKQKRHTNRICVLQSAQKVTSRKIWTMFTKRNCLVSWLGFRPVLEICHPEQGFPCLLVNTGIEPWDRLRPPTSRFLSNHHSWSFGDT